MAYGGDGTDWLSYADTDPNDGLNIYLNDGQMFYEESDGIYHLQSLSSFENVEGSKRGDGITGTDQVNVIKGLDGDDHVSALGGNDDVYGGKGKDTIHGDGGKDKIFGGDGNDTLYGDAGDDEIRGGKNDDTIYGGTGVDKLYGDEGNDVIHTGYAAGSTQQLFGGSGNDELWGTGGDLTIRMTGGSGKDVMHGFGAENRFIFTDKSDSVVGADRDRIVDFFRSEGDRIDLSGIDAKEGTSGNQAFSYTGSNAFSAKGQLHVVQSNGSWLVEGNTDSDLQAEFQIQVSFLGNGPGAQNFVL
jgi:Ca2+-binding RTX toxin-like protein